MKNQREIYKAILDGKTVRNVKGGQKVKMDKFGKLSASFAFAFPNDWEIYEKPVLYYRWKKKTGEGCVEVTSNWYRFSKDFTAFDGWTRIEPGKTFEEIQ